MLKEIRRQIAKANDIEFITSECTHKGDCAGTCPKCESEVEYLKQQLERRRRLGYTTRVAGLALGLAAISPALFTSCDPFDKNGDLIEQRLQGDVVPGDGNPGSEGGETDNGGGSQGA